MTTHSSTISLSRPARQVALVTGGSRGIGAATCRPAPAARKGRQRSRRAAIQAVVASIRDAGGRQGSAPIAPTGGSRMAGTAPGLASGPGGLAGGGTGRPQPLGEISEQDWRSSLDNNLTSTFFTLQCFLPGMMARGAGSAVTMASAGGRVASARRPATARPRLGSSC